MIRRFSRVKAYNIGMRLEIHSTWLDEGKYTGKVVCGEKTGIVLEVQTQ